MKVKKVLGEFVPTELECPSCGERRRKQLPEGELIGASYTIIECQTCGYQYRPEDGGYRLPWDASDAQIRYEYARRGIQID